MNITFLIGLVGSFTAATLFFPQVYTAWKTKRTKDLSWNTIYIGIANGTLWFFYGILKSDPFIYLTNAALFTAVTTLAILKKKYD